MSTVISGVYKSILRALSDLVEEVKVRTGHADIRYWDWENRADENELPKETLLGLDNWTFEENRGLWVIRFSLGLSSYRDQNLLRESEILDVIHEFTGEDKKIALRDVETGEQYNELVTTVWHLMPMASSEYRNFRPIAIEMRLTGATD